MDKLFVLYFLYSEKLLKNYSLLDLLYICTHKSPISNLKKNSCFSNSIVFEIVEEWEGGGQLSVSDSFLWKEIRNNNF